MTTLTKPTITAPRANSVHELQVMIAQLNQRFAALEALLVLGNGQTLQSVLQTVMSQPDGTVVKTQGALKTTK